MRVTPSPWFCSGFEVRPPPCMQSPSLRLCTPLRAPLPLHMASCTVDGCQGKTWGRLVVCSCARRHDRITSHHFTFTRVGMEFSSGRRSTAGTGSVSLWGRFGGGLAYQRLSFSGVRFGRFGTPAWSIHDSMGCSGRSLHIKASCMPL